ncbi:MAG: UDP-N-acetylmuramoyl-tripeptide--D-alanyl-D-alanine ligase [Firmicutes bacterium]|nr:UDP-N-acetylmuramoyl-tripeptide--D-alanyl-D-alanine ligase [Bacillota bacterium]
MIYIAIFVAALWFAQWFLLRLPHDLHMLQQNSYRNDRYRRWYKRNFRREASLASWAFLLPAAAAWISRPAALILFVLISVISLAWGLTHKEKTIKPLVNTDRVKRLRWGAFALALLPAALIGCLAWHAGSGTWTGRFMAMLAALAAGLFLRFSFVLAFCANGLLAPVENKINRGFYREAQEKLASMPQLRRVGVTGSYGKTSVKKILEAIASEKYYTLATPASYNTPMGITRTVREQLRPTHQVFIAEMGARQKGDIQELVELTAPQIGILTAIGPQHMETFGSQQAIVDTKFELIRGLPAGGVAVLNFDDPLILANAAQAPCATVSYSLHNSDCDFWAEDIRYDQDGCIFTLCSREEKVTVRSRLLGEHNVSNILAAAAAASQLSVPLSMAARGVKHLTPVAHRLELKHRGKYLVLDDAYNANPAGAKAALSVLAAMAGGQKIIITPGMVELGEMEEELNRQFAAEMTKVADYIILVGNKRGEIMEPALQAAGFPQERYYIAADLTDAHGKLAQIVQEGDVVLYENDLPDVY